jgi:dye decolorizing peroxidase
MSAPDKGARTERATSTRRQFLLGGTVAGVGAAAAIGADYVLNKEPATPVSVSEPLNGVHTVPFYGTHQAGIDTDAQAHALFLGLDLLDTTDRNGLRRMMTILTDDAARLTQGAAALADSEPELAISPARLTVTFGFGPRFVERAQGNPPQWLHALPAFSIDQLQPEYCDGDLFIQVASDDRLTVAHASRMLLKDARSFAAIRWRQQGFRNAHGSVKPGTTMRNLFGQVDGTANPTPGTAEFDRVVWNTEGWLAGGSSLVIRRIRMNLDKWDRLDRTGREQAIGRFLSNGAPLTSTPTGEAAEFDDLDFDAKTAIGFPVIPAFSHTRRAHSEDIEQRIYRRAYNYEGQGDSGELSNSGLVFAAFQADVDRQFTPIQERLDQLDLLNEWTTPVGSAVFAIPPGCSQGGYIGETLLV